MIWARRRPKTICSFEADFHQHLTCISVVLLDVIKLSWVTTRKWFSTLAMNPKNIMNRPWIICRLNSKERDLDVRVDVFSEEALPLLIGVGQHALSRGRIDFFVCKLHEILKSCAIAVEMGGKVRWVEEYSRVRNWSNLCAFWCTICNIVGPKKSSKPTCRLSRNNYISGLGEHFVPLIDRV